MVHQDNCKELNNLTISSLITLEVPPLLLFKNLIFQVKLVVSSDIDSARVYFCAMIISGLTTLQ